MFLYQEFFWNFAGCFKISIREGRKCALLLKLFSLQFTRILLDFSSGDLNVFHFPLTSLKRKDTQFEMLRNRRSDPFGSSREIRSKDSEFILSII